MESLTSYIQSRNFEEEVGRYLEALDDNVKIEYRVPAGTKPFFVDFYFPEGCSKLNWPAKTVIEIKLQLSYSSLNRILQRYTYLLENDIISQLIIIYKEGLSVDLFENYIESYKYKTKLQIYDFDRFANILKSFGVKEVEEKTAKSAVDILERAKQTLKSHRYTLFLGAGVSMDAKLPSWTQLLESLLKQENNIPYQNINEANANAISEVFSNSSIITGRYVFDGYRNSVKTRDGNDVDTHEVDRIIIERMRKALYKDQEKYQSTLIKSLANAIKTHNPVQVITYNYDDLLETQLDDREKFVSVFDKHIPRHNIIPIYHVHGMIARNQYEPSMPILSEKEYHKLYYDLYNWANIVQLHALNTTTCFFIGFSMTDPNQRRLLELSRLEDLNSGNADKLPHYVFLRKAPLKGEASLQVNEEHWQEIENMMSDFGLNVIWYKEYKQLPQIIEYIAGVNNDKPIII